MQLPEIYELFRQKKEGDCAITGLSILLGIPYLKVVAAAKKISPNALKAGLFTKEIRLIAKRLTGKELTSTPVKLDTCLDDMTGLLTLIPRSRKEKPAHVVVLIKGLIWDPDLGLLYREPEIYYSTTRYRPTTLLTYKSGDSY